MAIAIIIARTPTARYVSRSVVVTICESGRSVGAVVGAVGSTANDVIACDGQYDSEPVKEAKIVKVPSMSGVQLNVKKPSELVVVFPISLLLPFASSTVRVTSTPDAFVGRGN